MKKTTRTTWLFPARNGALAALALFLGGAIPAHSFSMDQKDLKFSIDSTISYGAIWRTEKQDPDLVGESLGDANYKRGPVSHTIKGTHEVAMDYKNLGAFVRFSEYYDFLNINRDKGPTNLPQNVKDEVGKDIELFDAFAQAKFDLGDMPIAARVGNQVINWGEALYFQGGIMSMNAFDLRKLRQPGSEIREALLPTPMAWLSMGVLKGVNLEGFYNSQFKKTQLEASGTFFSTSDQLGDPNILGFDLGFPFSPATRAPDVLARDGGEYGASLKYVLPFMTGTEMGLYYTNTHNRTPIISAKATPSDPLDPFNPLPTVNYYAEYPEDIKMAGLGLTSDLAFLGLGLQFEYAHRFNNPLQKNVGTIFGNTIPDAVNVWMDPDGPGPLPYMNVRPGVATQVQGYDDYKTGQFDLQLMKETASSNPFFADNAQFMVEAAVSRIWNMPDQDTTLESGVTTLDGASVPPTQTAWGYTARVEINYYNLLGPISLTPSFAFSHDVKGISPAGGNFLQDRKSLGGTLTFRYLSSYSLDLSYTSNYGAKNLMNADGDRDNSSVTFKYYF